MRDNSVKETESVLLRDFRDYLFAQLEKKIPDGVLLAQELSERLSVSASNAYKKIKGGTSLTLGEVLLLAGKYDISIDTFLTSKTDKAVFRYPSLLDSKRTPVGFITEIFELLQAMNSKPDFRIRYATNEIPIFHYLSFSEITAFKMYLWSQSVWETIDDKQYCTEWIEALVADANFRELCRRTYEAFVKVPSDEYYPVNMLDNTLNQIRFLHDTGNISTLFVQTLTEQLLDLIQKLFGAATNGNKSYANPYSDDIVAGDFELHYNEIMYTNNLILASNQSDSCVFSTLDNPNYLICSDERVASHVRNWFEKMKRKSVKISSDGERYRIKYFNELENRIHELRRRL